MSVNELMNEGGSQTAGGDESNMKTHAITRACEMCRKKKIKCDWRTPSCSYCIRYKTRCIYTPSLRSKRPSKKIINPKGDVERRLEHMESVLGIRASWELGKNSHYAPVVSDVLLAGQNSSTQRPEPAQNLSVFYSSTQPSLDKQTIDISLGRTPIEYNYVENTGLFFNPSTSVPALASFPNLNGELAKCQLEMEIATASVARGTTAAPHLHYGYSLDPTKMVPLPPLNEALPLIHLYFASFNQVFPLFHEISFMALISERYVATGLEDAGWWASINIILSQGYSLRAMSPNKGPDDDQRSITYLQNASIVGPQIILWGADLLSLQALLGMAIVVHGTPNSGCYPMLVAAAVRLAYMIGLHRQQEYDPTLTAVEIEQRKCIFWIAYILDKDVSIRLDMPFLQNDENIDLEIPRKDIKGQIFFLNSNSVEALDFFSLRVQLSIIQGMICKQLYTATASYQSPRQRETAIQELDRGLKEWRDSIPFDFSPQASKRALDGLSVLHILVLHATYFFSLMKLHHVPQQGFSSPTSSRIMESFNPRLFAPEPSCVSVARELMDLIKVAPQGCYASIWLVLYPSVSALITLLHNALHHPDDIHAPSDLQRVDPLVGILAGLAEMQENREVLRMYLFCVELRRRAMEVVTRYKACIEGHQVGVAKPTIL